MTRTRAGEIRDARMRSIRYTLIIVYSAILTPFGHHRRSRVDRRAAGGHHKSRHKFTRLFRRSRGPARTETGLPGLGRACLSWSGPAWAGVRMGVDEACRAVPSPGSRALTTDYSASPRRRFTIHDECVKDAASRRRRRDLSGIFVAAAATRGST